MVVAEEMLSPSPIKCVLGGKAHTDGILIGAAGVVAGSRMVEGGGLTIPAHGLGLAVVQVILVAGVVKGRPRASMTAPVAGYGVPVPPLRIAFNTLQILEPACANTLASMKADDDWHGEQFPLES
jgi:hypothetical protein